MPGVPAPAATGPAAEGAGGAGRLRAEPAARPVGRPPRPASVAAVVPLPVAVAVALAGRRKRRGHRDHAAGRHPPARLHGDDRAGWLIAPDRPGDARPQAEL